MMSTLLSVLCLFFAVLGASACCVFVWAFCGIQKSLIFTKKFEFLVYNIEFVSTMRKQMDIRIKKD